MGGAVRPATTYRAVLRSLRDAYDREAAERERTGAGKTPWKLAERDAFLRRIRAEGARTLAEIGAGTGQDSRFFLDEGLEVVAIDPSPRMVEYCRAKGVDARVGDVLHLDLPYDEFDAVYSLNVFLHVPDADLDRALVSIAAVMRPGALFFLGVYGGRPHEGPLKRDDHVPPRFFALRTDAELHARAGRHFETVDFHTVPLGEADFYFQSLTLRRPVRQPAGAP